MVETVKGAASRGPVVKVMRSQLGQVRGLGPARSGTAHWWIQRVTAVALVPLTIWFVLSVFHLEGLERARVVHWAGHPVNATLLLALIVATFHHMQLGLQVVIEDYVHVESVRLSSVLAVKAIAILLGLASAVAVLKMAFAG
jgi:succinate dehydrogenase / fumarate reductase membrane anchor subunit